MMASISKRMERHFPGTLFMIAEILIGNYISSEICDGTDLIQGYLNFLKVGMQERWKSQLGALK
jgi:hypothetical protein